MSDDSSDPQISIVTRFVTDSSGADQAVADVQRVGEASARSGEAFDSTALGNIRSVHHLLEGLFEVGQGGAAAIGGLAAEGRVATEVFAGMLGPLAPLALAISTITMLAVPMIERWREHKDKTDLAAESTDTFKDSLAQLTAQFASSYPNVVAQLKEATEQLKEQAKAAQELQRAQRDYEDAKISGKLADLDQQEEIDSAGKDADQLLTIKRDYETRRMALKQELDREKAEANEQAKKDALEKAQADLSSNRDQASADGLKLTQAWAALHVSPPAIATSDATQAQDRLAALADKARSAVLSGKETQEYEDLERQLPGLLDAESKKGPSYVDRLQKLQGQLKEEQQREIDAGPSLSNGYQGNRAQADDARIRQNQIHAEIDAIANYQASTKAAADEITKTQPEFQKLNAAVPALTDVIKAAQLDVDTAGQQLTNLGKVHKTEVLKQDLQNSHEQAQRDYENRESLRKDQEDRLQTQIRAQSDATMKAVLEKQLTGLQATGIRDKASVDLATGKIGKDQYRELTDKSDDMTVDEQTEAARQLAQQNRKDDTAANKNARTAGEDATAAVRALGGSRQQLDAAHSAVADLGKGQAQGAEQLIGVLNQLVATTKGLTDGQVAAFQNIVSRLKTVEQTLGDHRARMDNLANHG